MLQDMDNDNMVHHHPQEQQHHLPIDEITSPLSAQLLEFCESELLFPDTLQNSSEVGSSLNNNYSYDEHSSHSSHMNKFNVESGAGGGGADQNDEITNATTTNKNNNDFSILFKSDQYENDYITPDHVIDFSVPPHYLLDGGVDYPPPPPVEECYNMSSLVTSSSSILDPVIGNYQPAVAGNLNVPLPAENSGVFSGAGGLFLGHHQEVDFQGDNCGGLFFPDTMQRVFNFSNDFQLERRCYLGFEKAVSGESQHMVSGPAAQGGRTCDATLPLVSSSDITSSLEDSTFKVGKLSVEQRKERIHRYMKKRNERNFSKKIKYACRKTLADSRPRVRGRFAKNDEFGEREASRTYEEDSCIEDVTHNFHYDPNHAAALGHNGRIFAGNCLPPSHPYDICNTLYCTDGQMR